MFFRNLAALLLATVVMTHFITEVEAQESWPRFRGPTGDGVVKGKLPLRWNATSGITWKAPVVGKGHSSPVVADGKIWITTGVTEPLTTDEKAAKLAKVKDPNGLELVGALSQRLLCFEFANGKLIHDVEIFRTASPEPIHLTNTYASPTPAIHQGKVFVHFGTYGTACVDTQSGNIVWRFDRIKIDHQNGPGSSPIVWKDLLIVHFDGTDRQCIVALRQSDGAIAWQTDRSGNMDPKPELQKAYCTPTLIEGESGPELISPAANWVYGYDPRTGSELWKISYGRLGFSTVPCPIVHDGVAYVCTSFMQSRLLAVKHGGRGDVTTSNVLWTSDSNIPQKPSLAFVRGQLYVVSDAGILTCLNAKTGEEIWRHRLDGKYAASPLIVDDKVYVFNQQGKTTVLQAGDEYRELTVNQLEGSINASPAAVNGSLIVRTEDNLYRIDGEAGGTVN